jgi:hypothetical protein
MPQITGIYTAANVELQEVWEGWDGDTAETDPYLLPTVQYDAF